MSAPPRLDDQLCFALYAASRAVVRAYQPLLKMLGLTYSQYIAMMVLWEVDGLRVSELGQRLQLDSGTLTPLLKRLEASGLLLRERDTADERVVRIRLTAAGHELGVVAGQEYGERLCALGTDLNASFDRLRDQLKELTLAAREERGVS